jgi:NAD(P)-dependent dehydrogenase (short-subunit alcohol dehydrogenase family)
MTLSGVIDMSDSFTSKVVLVTGAGVGIGLGLCRALAEAGALVALNDLDGVLAQTAAAQINAEIGTERVVAYGCDVADVTAVRQMVGAWAEQHGRLDILIANAGITNFGSFLAYTPEAFDRVMGVNLRGTYFTAQAAAQKMIEFGVENGRILLTSSVTGVQAYPNLSAYGISKASIRHMAATLALELGPYGITVNAITPGAIVTERTLKDDPLYEQNWQEVAPNGRVGTVTDIVNTALFLASPAARHITGQAIVVDGGWTKTSPIPAATPELPEESSKLK